MARVAEYDAEGIAARGVGRFLAEHEECGEGFQIAREHGSARGALQLVCSGCGEHTGYGGADPALLRAHGIDASTASGGGRFRPSRETMERWLPAPAALPWWVPNAYILVVIAVGLGMIAFGVLRDRPPQRATMSSEPPATTAPAPTTATPPLAGGTAASALPSGSPEPAPAKPKRATAKPDLHRVEILGRFALGVPEGWSSGTGGGAVLFVAPSGDAELRLFLEPGASRPASHADQAADFLAREHPGAKVSRPRPLRIGKERAIEIVARYPGGEERAALLSASGYSFLMVHRIASDASGSLRSASLRAMKSFRPS